MNICILKPVFETGIKNIGIQTARYLILTTFDTLTSSESNSPDCRSVRHLILQQSRTAQTDTRTLQNKCSQ